MFNKLVRLGVAATGVAVLAAGGTAAEAAVRGPGGSPSVSSATVVSQQAGPAATPTATPATPAATAPAMSDAEIARYLAENPLIETSADQVKPVGEDLDIDPDTGCLTRESAARFTVPAGADTAGIKVGSGEMPNCWDLVHYLRNHPKG